MKSLATQKIKVDTKNLIREYDEIVDKLYDIEADICLRGLVCGGCELYGACVYVNGNRHITPSKRDEKSRKEIIDLVIDYERGVERLKQIEAKYCKNDILCRDCELYNRCIGVKLKLEMKK